MMGGANWLGLCFGGLFTLALGVGLIVLVIWAVGALARPATPPSPPSPPAAPNPLDIVKMRYARGEITKEEYDQLVRDLS